MKPKNSRADRIWPGFFQPLPFFRRKGFLGSPMILGDVGFTNIVQTGISLKSCRHFVMPLFVSSIVFRFFPDGPARDRRIFHFPDQGAPGVRQQI